MIKKILLSIGLVCVLAASVMADTIAVSLPTGSGNGAVTNLVFQGPAKILSISVTAGTNATLRFFDSPYFTNTISAGSYTNVTKSVGVVSNTYVSPFGVTYTNFYPAITFTTNTLTAAAQVRETILNAGFVSNTVSTITFGAGRYVGGGLLITNLPIPSPTPVIVSVEFEKIEP